MLDCLIQLPSETLGHNILGFLEMIDIIQLENAAASSMSQQLLKTILPYCPPILLDSEMWFEFNRQAVIWCNKRRLRVQHANIPVESLCEVSVQHDVFGNIELYLESKATCEDIEPLKNSNINQRVTSVHIEGCKDQDPVVIELLFLLLSCVDSLYIQSFNLSQWMEHIKQIGPCLRELSICDNCAQFKTITEYCPYLEKLSLRFWSTRTGSTILQSIANNCPHLRSIAIDGFTYNTSAECNADLTAFAEKCPQLEELNLYSHQLTDQSVIALAQHCSRLKKLGLNLTVTSMIALSESGLPLEKLDIPRIPIPSAEIAAQCAHALSRIRYLVTYSNSYSRIQYMTGLRQLCLESSEDHLLVPHLLLLLQGQCCVGLESLTIGSDSSITPQLLYELVALCPQLHTLQISKPTCTSDAVLVELTHSCPHLQKVTLDSNGKVTDVGVLALTAHCRQLRELDMPHITVTEETVRQLAQHCRRLTELRVLHDGTVFRKLSKREIRAIR